MRYALILVFGLSGCVTTSEAQRDMEVAYGVGKLECLIDCMDAIKTVSSECIDGIPKWGRE